MSGLFHWAGGKGRIVDALMSHIVPSARQPALNWIEPFVGGGAVALEAMRRLRGDPRCVWWCRTCDSGVAKYQLQGRDAGHEDGAVDPSG